MGKRISLLCEMLYYYDLHVMQSGGGERYAVDLVQLLRKQGYEVDVYQFSHQPKKVKYKDINITGLGNVLPTRDYAISLNEGVEKFYELTQDCDGYIFLTMNLANIRPPKLTISISHGIYWDFQSPNYKYPEWNDNVKRWIRNVDKTVSVDSNTVNWVRANYPKLIDQMYLIPNYCDNNVFKPYEKSDKSKFTVLYSRRFHQLRGYPLMLECAEYLTKKYDDIEFLFVGKGLGDIESQMKQWCKSQRNCKHESYDMSEMHKVYPRVDISVVPTTASEGTSLSAIESITCGIPLIATDVGGLNDICIDGVNGLKIRANQLQELIDAVEYAYLHRDEVKNWSMNALEISKGFTKDKWDKKWIKILKETFQ